VDERNGSLGSVPVSLLLFKSRLTNAVMTLIALHSEQCTAHTYEYKLTKAVITLTAPHSAECTAETAQRTAHREGERSQRQHGMETHTNKRTQGATPGQHTVDGVVGQVKLRDATQQRDLAGDGPTKEVAAKIELPATRQTLE
jgi:hypothetical protein